MENSLSASNSCGALAEDDDNMLDQQEQGGQESMSAGGLLGVPSYTFDDITLAEICKSPMRGSSALSSPGSGRGGSSGGGAGGSTGGGGTMKEYEEHLAALRKDNFGLKLRIYFLEERLEASTTPHHQDNLIKKNIQLKMKIESMSQELSERKDLLLAAARALEITENSAAKRETELLGQLSSLQADMERQRIQGGTTSQGCHSAGKDSVALYTAAFNLPPPPAQAPPRAAPRKIMEEASTQVPSAAPTSRKNGDDVRDTSEDKSQLEELKRENANSLQMIQGCLERIKTMDRDTKKLTASLQRKEERIAQLQCQLRQANADGSHGQLQGSSQHLSHTEGGDMSEKSETNFIQKYEELLNYKDNRINDLEEALKNLSSSNCDNSHKIGSRNGEAEWKERKSLAPPAHSCNQQSNVQDLLTKRLQELAYFLDSLLSHRCVIGSEKKQKVQDLLEQSLHLSSSLELDPEALRLLDQSCLECSFSNLSQSFHLQDLTKLLGHHLSLDDTQPILTSHQSANPNCADPASEKYISFNKEIFTSESNKEFCNCRGNKWSENDVDSDKLEKVLESMGSQTEIISSNILQEKDQALKQLEEKKSKIMHLEKEFVNIKQKYENDITEKEIEILTLVRDVEQCKDELKRTENSHKNVVEQLETDKCHLQQELERTESQVRELQEMLEEAVRAEEEAVRAEEEAVRAEGEAGSAGEEGEQGQVCPSPDLGIDSDRHSSLEPTGPSSIDEEVASLRYRLQRKEQQLGAALRQLAALERRKRHAGLAICQQIHHTTAVLRQVRDNLT